MRKNDVFGTLEARNAERVAFCLLKMRKNNVFGTLETRNAEKVALKQEKSKTQVRFIIF